jgi:hypothetical protein
MKRGGFSPPPSLPVPLRKPPLRNGASINRTRDPADPRKRAPFLAGAPFLACPFAPLAMRARRVIVAIYRSRYGLINNSMPRRETRTRRLGA